MMAIFKRSDEPVQATGNEADKPVFLDFAGPGEATAAERVGRWFVLIIAVALGAWLTWVLASSFVPRWWAQHVGGRVDGSLGAGTAWGFGYGFFATFLSLSVLIQARRKFLAWWGKLAVVVLALAVSAPNFMTLAVTIGTGKSSHAGRRIFDVNAPGFQWATLIGVVVGELDQRRLSFAGAATLLDGFIDATGLTPAEADQLSGAVAGFKTD